MTETATPDPENAAAPVEEEGIPYGEVAAEALEILRRQTTAAQLADAEHQLALQQAARAATERRLLEARRTIVQLEELGDLQRRRAEHTDAELRRHRELEQAAAVALDRARPDTYVPDPLGSEDLELKPIDPNADIPRDALVVITRRDADRIALALEELDGDRPRPPYTAAGATEGKAGPSDEEPPR